jgi:hypothetical protein
MVMLGSIPVHQMRRTIALYALWRAKRGCGLQIQRQLRKLERNRERHFEKKREMWEVRYFSTRRLPCSMPFFMTMGA